MERHHEIDHIEDVFDDPPGSTIIAVAAVVMIGILLMGFCAGFVAGAYWR